MISIIIRAKNEMPWLKYTLLMLRRQTRRDFEVIAVDSGSDDGSYEMLLDAKPQVLYRIDPADYIPGKVLNTAIAHAKGEIIVFNNADCIPADEHWLANLVQPLESHPDLAAVFANQLPRPSANPLVRKDYLRAFGDGKIAAGWKHFFSLASSAIRADIIRAFPFNETLNYSEDIEWSWRMKQLGNRIAYVPTAKVQHSHNYNLRAMMRRFRGEGKAEAVIYREHYLAHPEAPGLVRSVILPAGMEILRDWIWLLRRGELHWMLIAPVYRFVQRYFAYRGRLE